MTDESQTLLVLSSAGEGAIIGDKNYVSVDGRTFTLTPAPNCSRILLTDSRDKLFTVVASWDQSRTGMAYTLLLTNKVVGIQPDLQVRKECFSLLYCVQYVGNNRIDFEFSDFKKLVTTTKGYACEF